MKAALFKPVIYFERGWWRVKRFPAEWRHLRQADKNRILAAHTHIGKLNAAQEALVLRTAYYESLGARRKAERRTGPQYREAIMASFLQNRFQGPA